MTISLCLMVWNELRGCKTDVPLLPKALYNEVYAVDGGSTDGTVEYLESMGIPVYRQPKKGLNAAYVHAVDMSKCDAVVVFFPKGTLPVQDLLKFPPLFEDGCDLIVASRNIKGALNEEDDRMLKPRKWGVLLLARLASLIWRKEGYMVKDVLHGFKGFTVKAFKKIDPLDHGLSIDIEMVVRSYRLKLKRAEFPTSERPRLYGDTHFMILPTWIEIMRYLWFEFNRKG